MGYADLSARQLTFEKIMGKLTDNSDENVEGFPDYKYREGEILKEISEYVADTYSEHYSQGKYQATEFIIDGGHGIGFTLGNILKYAQRYGRKGSPSDWRKDLMKVIHYSIIALHVHDNLYDKEGK